MHRRWTTLTATLPVLLVAQASGQSEWAVFEETTIQGTVSGTVTQGHIFRTQTGHIYEVTAYTYQYVYEYRPSVLVLTNNSVYRLIVDGFDEPLLARCHNCRVRAGTAQRRAAAPDRVGVRNVQTALVLVGYRIAVDGELGASTVKAITDFQRENQLSATGEADARTLLKLASVVAEQHSDDIDALRLAVNLVRPRAAPTSPSTPVSTPSVIESYIVNDFDGLDYGNIYRLANGQLWEQVEAWIWIWIWVNPSVLIWDDGGVYKMKVENIDHAVAVRRIN